MIDISIIVPVYNVEDFLENCIDSILEQKFTNFELILVDDGSLDASGNICDIYENKDSRIKVIHKNNGGLSSARNAGLSIAKGKYVGFIDSDDYIDENMYEILYKNILEEDADISICSFERVYSYSNNICENHNISPIILDNVQALKEIYKENGADFVVAWNKLYKRELFSNIKFKEGKIHEDEYICHEILFKSKRIVYIPVNLYNYLQRDNSIINSKFNIKKLDAVYALYERKNFFKEKGLIDLKHKAEYSYIQYFFKYYFDTKENLVGVDKELKYLKRGFIKSFPDLLKNPLYNWKEKLLWVIFIISPSLCEIYLNR